MTGLRGLLSRRIENAEVVVSKSRITLPLPFPIAVPSGPATARGADQASPALEVLSVRAIEVRDLQVTTAGGSVSLDLDASVDGDRLQIGRLLLTATTTRIIASGAVASLARLDGTLDAKADPLDLDEMIAIGTAVAGSVAPSGAPGVRSPATPMHLRMSLNAPAGRFATHSFRNLTTTADIVPGRLALAPLSLEIFGGALDGRLDADTGRQVPQLRLTGKIDGVDVAELMKASGSAGSITGRLAGTVSLSATGTDAATLMRAARGTVTAAITQGTMPHLDMVRTVVLAFGKPSGAPAQGSGTAFSRLAGTFALTNGTLTSENLAFASRDFDMHGRGALEMASGAVDARADVVLSEELTAQAGTDLRRYAQQDGRVTVPATVGGTLGEPRVSIDTAGAAQRALTNELKRRATSMLGGLFKKKQ
jgi:uncharacterized protein involved in outer membrane biogenesis